MNVTEKKAYEWLKAQGITVRYQHRKSPDFITPDGIGYEVKLARDGQKAVYFTWRQWKMLRWFEHELYVLVFEREDKFGRPISEEPRMFKFSDVFEGNFGPYQACISPYQVTISLPLDIVDQVRVAAAKSGLRLQKWIVNLIQEKLDNEDQ